MSTTPDGPPQLSPFGLFNALLHHRRLILGIMVGLATVLVAWALVRPAEHSASASFIAQSSESRRGSAMALAQQFGINIGTDASGHSPQFYADLLEGREMMIQALGADYSDVLGGTAPVTLYDHWGVADQQRAIRQLRKRITVRLARETGVVSLSVQSRHAGLSERIAANLLAELQAFNLHTRQSQARHEAEFVAERLDDAQRDLRGAEVALQDFLRGNRQFQDSPELVFEHDRLRRQVAMRQQLVNSLHQSYEQARIDAVRDTPVMTVLGSPEGSAIPARRFIIVRGLVGLLMGLLVGSMLAVTQYYLRRTSAIYESEYLEFRYLSGQALADLRDPRRLLRRQPGTDPERPVVDAPPVHR